ncbi:ATP-dependent DNA helicase RecG [Parvularcula sp. LCG005]|uniref:ATP-dependent DNA helicase RecG n=1 Tax=Parvularcula sp. LCG005 TaxID=3078805 RepID=UPI0029421FE2|nr:ATP-dependent DNA helicase RecG [Parvularcula sp. LCG005]WOI54078.1 ATP-dependent DNA helicase RecG [Parvularcula sp. LCG005]
MRPALLNPLFQDITVLKGIGPKTAPLVSKVAGPRIVDLLWTLPQNIVDRTYRPRIADAEDGRLATISVHVDSHHEPPRGKSLVPWKVLCSDDTGYLTLIFFRPRADFLHRSLPTGQTRLVSGTVEYYGSERQMAHPDYIISPDEFSTLPLIEPVYPLTAGLAGKTIRRAVEQAVDRTPDVPEWLAEDVLQKERWPDWKAALIAAHQPSSKLDLSADSTARRRLAYDEILAHQLALALIRARRASRPGRILKGDGQLTAAVREALPFRLTAGQEEALHDITTDMAAPSRMVRLVQGDVGSGKTVVALLALLTAVEAGAQAALMAPTEILARQHFDEIAPLCDRLNIACVLITGRDKGQERQAKRDGVRKGYVQVVVGTHALFSDDVAFADLGLVVVDEQHRFGVAQRLELQDKGQQADVLVMTATPIPRTLALTTYGDMDISQIREKPPGRKPVATKAIPAQRLDAVIEAVGRTIAKGEQVYWVCPLVSPSETMDMVSAEDRAATLKARFGDAVGLVHGQMKGPQKDAVVSSFYRGDIQVLVATTVIEVGVNTPNATVIVIEHAERFGLAQLHQLRGRVGRGDKPASCILLYHAGESGLGPTAKARLNALRETEDGFVIAEEDLALRGPGDSLGTAQSGFPQFRMADIGSQGSLLQMASDDARRTVMTDPELKTERGEALRILLYLFSRDDAVKLLRAG